MNNMLTFTKMQGAGNDFIILNNLNRRIPAESYSALAIQFCRRRISMGADGLMIVEPAQQGGDYAMVFYNADGTLGEMCGNGARCIARYGHDHGLAGEIQRIETTAGLVTGWRLAQDQYRIQLNDPSVFIPEMTVEAAGQSYVCTYAELGSPGIPHAVVHLEYWDTLPEDSLRKLGCELRYAKAFPKGANVTFWKPLGESHAKAITYERGVEDFTLACGTGAGSTAASMCVLGFAVPADIRLDFPGGTLHITLEKQNETIRNIYLTGPAATVAEGSIYLQ